MMFRASEPKNLWLQESSPEKKHVLRCLQPKMQFEEFAEMVKHRSEPCCPWKQWPFFICLHQQLVFTKILSSLSESRIKKPRAMTKLRQARSCIKCNKLQLLRVNCWLQPSGTVRKVHLILWFSSFTRNGRHFLRFSSPYLHITPASIERLIHLTYLDIMSHKGPTSRRALRCSKDSPTTSLMRRPTAFACRLPNLNKKLCRCQQLFYSLTFTAFHYSFIWIITHNSPANLQYWWWMIHIYITGVSNNNFSFSSCNISWEHHSVSSIKLSPFRLKSVLSMFLWDTHDAMMHGRRSKSPL